MKRGLVLIFLFLSLYLVRNFLQNIIRDISGYIFSTPAARIIYSEKSALNHNISEDLKKNGIQSFRIEELERENKRLRGLLNFKQEFTSSCAARVIGRVKEEISDQLIISAGIKDGVDKNSAVLTPLGLVGVIEKAGRESSLVLPYSDPRFNISVRVASTREIGLLVGGTGKGEAKVLYLGLDTDAKAGDVILTSGEGFLPGGLVIGKIIDVFIHPSQIYKIAKVRPFADLNKIEEVLVLMGKQ